MMRVQPYHFVKCMTNIYLQKLNKLEMLYKNTYIEDLEYALKASTYDIYYRIMRIKYMSSLFGEHIDCAGDRFMIDYKSIDVLLI